MAGVQFARPPLAIQKQLGALESAVARGDVGLLGGVEQAISIGYLAIGAAQSRLIYNPADFNQLRDYYDPYYGEYVMPEEYRQKRKIVRAFSVGTCALLCSLYGNMNQPDRPELSQLFKDVSGPHFGWEKTPTGIAINVVPQAQSLTRLMGDDLRGVIDMVWNDGSFGATYEDTQLASARPHARQATFHTTGADLPFDVLAEPYKPPTFTDILPLPRSYDF